MKRLLVVVLVAVLAAGCTGSDKPPKVAQSPPAGLPTLAGAGMWIGGFANGDAANWQAENERIAGGKMRVRRSFNPKIPATWAASAAGQDAATGIISFHSIRPPDLPGGGQDMQGVIDGVYDSDITGWAKGAPRTGPVFGTMSHEPEAPDKRLNGKLFVAGFRHFYQLAKAANPNIQLAPVHMSFQWQAGSRVTAKPDEWWVGSEYCDFIGVDDYNKATATGRSTVADDPEFQRWYDWAKGKGKPLAVAEYGRMENPDDPQALPRELKSAESWLLDHNFIMWLFWNGTGSQADWTMKAATADPWSAIAARGRQAA